MPVHCLGDFWQLTHVSLHVHLAGLKRHQETIKITCAHNTQHTTHNTQHTKSLNVTLLMTNHFHYWVAIQLKYMHLLSIFVISLMVCWLVLIWLSMLLGIMNKQDSACSSMALQQEQQQSILFWWQLKVLFVFVFCVFCLQWNSAV